MSRMNAGTDEVNGSGTIASTMSNYWRDDAMMTIRIYSATKLGDSSGEELGITEQQMV